MRGQRTKWNRFKDFENSNNIIKIKNQYPRYLKMELSNYICIYSSEECNDLN